MKQKEVNSRKGNVHGRLNASWKICSLAVNGQSFLVIDGYLLNSLLLRLYPTVDLSFLHLSSFLLTAIPFFHWSLRSAFPIFICPVTSFHLVVTHTLTLPFPLLFSHLLCAFVPIHSNVVSPSPTSGSISSEK